MSYVIVADKLNFSDCTSCVPEPRKIWVELVQYALEPHQFAKNALEPTKIWVELVDSVLEPPRSQQARET